MAVTLGTITVLDGNANPITLQVLDQSGVGLGAFTTGHVLIDGVAGVLRAQVTAANALKVDASGATVPISGTITANIGTVATLALEGGNLSQIAAAYVLQNTTLGTTKQVLTGGSVTTAAPTYTTGNIQPLSLTTAGLLRVDASGTTINAAQSGTWTVQPGNTANTTAWLVGLNTTPLIANGNGVLLAPTSSSAAGIPAVVSTALETGHVLKASAGNLYGLEVTTTTVGGIVLVHNSTTVPAAGAVTPVKAYQVPASSTLVVGWNPPLPLSTGISVSFTTATTPFTQTNSATAYFSGQVV